MDPFNKLSYLDLKSEPDLISYIMLNGIVEIPKNNQNIGHRCPVESHSPSNASKKKYSILDYFKF